MSITTKISQEVINKIVDMVANTELPYIDIAKNLNVSASTVRHYAVKNFTIDQLKLRKCENLKKNRNVLDENIVQSIINYTTKTNLTGAEIARQLGISQTSIRNYKLRNPHIKFNTPVEPRKLSETSPATTIEGMVKEFLKNLSDQKTLELYRLIDQKLLNDKELGKRFGVNQYIIFNVRRNYFKK